MMSEWIPTVHTHYLICSLRINHLQSCGSPKSQWKYISESSLQYKLVPFLNCLFEGLNKDTMSP